MELILAGNWWALALRGVVAVLFGILTFLMPGITLAALIALFAAYAVVDGVFNIIAAVRGRKNRPRWWALLLEGLLGVAAGVVTVFWPGITALVLLYLIAAWAIVTGAFEIAAAIRLRKEITGEWLLVVSGILSILLGMVLIIFPGAGALTVVFWIGAYALVSGAVLLALAFRLRSWSRSGSPQAAHGAA